MDIFKGKTMLKFFRNIRRELLKASHFKSYTLYAIGEIMLVIIGILIALFINDWRKNIALKQDELEILKSLDAEFKETKAHIEKYIDRNQNLIEINQLLLAYCANADTDFSNTKFDSLLYNGAWNVGLTLNQGVFSELISTGKLSNISSQNLRALLSLWAGVREDAVRTDNLGLEYLQTKISNYLDQKVHWAAMSKFDPDGTNIEIFRAHSVDRILFSKELELENFIVNHLWYTQSKINTAKSLINLNTQILKAIESSQTTK